MPKATDYKLLIGNFGTPYIAKVLKHKPSGLKPGVGIMSSDRVAIPESDFIAALLQWTLEKLDDGSTVLEIKEQDGTVTALIEIKDLKLLDK